MRKQIAKIYTTTCSEELYEAKECLKIKKPHFCSFFFAEIVKIEKVNKSKKTSDFTYEVNAIDDFYDLYDVDKFLSINQCVINGKIKYYQYLKKILSNTKT